MPRDLKMPTATISQLFHSTDMLCRNIIPAITRLMVFVLCAAFAQGCSGTPTREFSEVTVNVTVPQGIETDMLRAFIYDSESGDLSGQIFISGKEQNSDGTITFTSTEKLRRGSYDIIVYNFDMPDTFIRGEDNIATLEAYTAEVNRNLLSSFGSDIISVGAINNTPDIMGVARIMDVAVADGVVIAGNLNQVTVPTNLTLGAEGLQWAISKSAVASGFATSWFLGTGEPGNGGRIWFEMVSGSNDSLNASILSFGNAGDSYDFTFNVTTSDGSYNYLTTTGRNFKFEKSIVIPEPQQQEDKDGNGFVPRIGEWNNISVDIPV